MAEFVAQSEFQISAAELFAWHARPAAFFRLMPPWERVTVQATRGPFADGFQIRMVAKIIGPIQKTWTAELFDVRPGVQFRDRQLRGPFARWEHTHRMESLGEQRSRLVDQIEYDLPLGAPGRWFGGGLVRGKLQAMFAYRHALLQADFRQLAPYAAQPKLRIGVTGSTGLVGQPLCWFLAAAGHEVVRFVRQPRPPHHPDDGTEARLWNPYETLDPGLFADLDAVIHLAGESIAEGRWTAAKQQRIRDSRVIPTGNLARALAVCRGRVRTFLSASAVGIYGATGDQLRRETDPPGTDFLAEVAQAWEAAAEPAANAGLRVVHPRIGIVQTPAGGALGKQLLPFSLGAGAVLGSGEQWQSWVSVHDLVYALHHALRNESVRGAFHAVAPQPVTNRVYGRVLARVLGRPYLFTLPAPFLRLVFGNMADAALLASMRCEPEQLLATGFHFEDPELEPALRKLLGLVTQVPQPN